MCSRDRILAILALALVLGCGKTEPGPEGVDPRIVEARKLLAAAGFPDGRGFPQLEILYNVAEWHERIAAAIQERWRKELGIPVELRNAEWKVFLDEARRGHYEIIRGAHIGEYADPRAMLTLFTADNPMNSTGWTSTEYDRLIAQSDAVSDRAERYKLLARAERILLDEAPVAPIFHYIGHNFMKPFIKGVYHNAQEIHPLQGVTLEGEGRPKDGVLIFNAGEEPHSLDPALSDDIGGLKTLMHLFEGLVNYHPKDASPVPAAAERWDVSPDGKTYTFHLRPAQWSNRNPLTATDFVYAWRRVVDPKTASKYVDRMFVVKNARTIARGKAPVETLGVRAIDDRTLSVELEHPAPYFLQLLCLNIYYPVHRATVEKYGLEWTKPEHMVHNGPYRLALWKLNDRKVFEKNPRYRAASEVKLEKFVFLHVSRGETAFQMYEAGECHWLFHAPPERMDQLMKRPDHMSGPTNQVYFYAFNTKVKPLDDPRVRRALSLAIDREKITRFILRGGEAPATRLTPPLYPGYDVP